MRASTSEIKSNAGASVANSAIRRSVPWSIINPATSRKYAPRYTPGVRFDPQYINHVLNDNFEDAKVLFLSPLMAIHHAHLVMLAERGIVSASEARTLRNALDSICVTEVRSAPY